MASVSIEINTIQDISNALTQIQKIDKYEREEEYAALCTILMQKTDLLEDFFSRSPYTGKHSELAAQMYLVCGKQIYELIKRIIPTDIGKTLGNWDEFMLSQIPKLTYAVWHRKKDDYTYYNQIASNLAPFLKDIEYICDDALYIEMMCKIARTFEFDVEPSLRGKQGNTLDRSKYVIDYDFMKSRYPCISKTNNGMRRFLDLFQALADYDYMSAMKAWGDFYYLFESIYENTPPTQTTFTGELYNCFFSTFQYQTPEDATDIVHGAEAKLNTLIHDYGWKYLHHAFEINTSTDWCIDWIYKNLSDDDKNKADQAKEDYHLSHQSIRKNADSKKDYYDDIEHLLCTNSEAGITAWKKCLIQLNERPKLTKKAQLDAIDSIILHVSRYQESNNQEKMFINPALAPLVKVSAKTIYQSILSDEWLLDFYAVHFQQTGCSADIASLALLTNDLDKFHRLLDGFTHNPNVNITLHQFLKNVYTHSAHMIEFMLNDAERIIRKKKEGIINEKDNPDEFLVSQLSYDYLEKISLLDHPELINQLRKLISYCKQHCLEN